MIKTHPVGGYEILKTVPFPWPVAEVVKQHHESYKGTGYPDRLSYGDILTEAGIISVADTVEAMSSHRPYRPALGIKIAIEEIEEGRGEVFRPDIVDACLIVFRENRVDFLGAG